MRPLYISATRQDCGKTSFLLGLIQVLRERGHDCGYIKPVGQHYVSYRGKDFDEDAALIYDVFHTSDDTDNMSPIAIGRNFTRQFIENPDVEPLERQIVESLRALQQRHSTVLVEGTGHAGVGSCFGLSNARVAQLTGSDVVIVAQGGIGRPIDEVALSLALFEKHDVRVLGVVVNKVIPEKLDQISDTVGKGLKLLGTRLLGTVPYVREMTTYTIQQVVEHFGYEVLCHEEALHHRVDRVLVAAMEPQNFLDYIKPNSLIITPGDRTSNILMTIALSGSEQFHDRFSMGGLILTGGLLPTRTIHALLQKSGIPVLTTPNDTFTVAARMKDLLFKIQAKDGDKIHWTRDLVDRHIDVDYILDCMDQ